jgi:ubiquinone/menaquinone biosynthesis C-methylase UbiE
MQRTHWEHVYRAKGPEQLSWFQAEAKLSRELIAQFAPARDSRVIDVGAGASTLVDGLLADGYSQVTVLDLSVAALDLARERLGADAKRVEWLEGDVLTAALPAASADVWHDRAVFHFSHRSDGPVSVRRAGAPRRPPPRNRIGRHLR